MLPVASGDADDQQEDEEDDDDGRALGGGGGAGVAAAVAAGRGPVGAAPVHKGGGRQEAGHRKEVMLQIQRIYAVHGAYIFLALAHPVIYILHKLRVANKQTLFQRGCTYVCHMSFTMEFNFVSLRKRV